MIKIPLKELSSSFRTRDRGEEAFIALEKRLLDNANKDPIIFEVEESETVSFSFLDEFLQRYHAKINRKYFFFLLRGSESGVYDKLARFSGLRNIQIYFLTSPNGKPKKVIPKKSVTFSNIQYEEKPTQE